VLTPSGHRPLSDIAREIRADWKSPNYAAVPYLEALRALNDITEDYGADPATQVVGYFLANARTWKGEKAKAIKSELNKILKGKGYTVSTFGDGDVRIYDSTGRPLVMASYAASDELVVELFSAGKWNGDEYTVEDLHDMAKNFQARSAEIKPYVKLGHDESSPLNKAAIGADGQPS